MTAEEALKIVNALLHSTFGQRLNDVKSVVFLETWKGQTYEVIAEKLGYQNDYIKQVGSQLWRSLSQATGEDVTKKNIQAVLHRYQQSQSTTQDWGEAIDVSRFYGRQAELQTLATWIGNEHCRFVGIFGLGGIGKTTLSVKLAGQIQSQFEYVIWRSLRQALPLNTLLAEILPILMGSEATINSSISILMQQLRQKRCLLVFDNVESILQSGNRGGQYQQGFEGYQQLFERICDELHQSCLIVTGREKPGGIAVRSGKKLPVRSLSLSGLSAIDGQQILMDKGLDTTPQHQTLVNYFGGNPLALKIAATAIQDIFCGDTQAFLAQGNTLFSDLWDLLRQQFERLSPLQQQIMYWLAINREGVTPTKLQTEILPQVPWRELLEALESLKGRSLVETAATGLTQQPVIMEYVTEQFIQTIEREMIRGELNLFKNHALIEAQTQDYVREAQIQFILHPLVERLFTHFDTQAQLEEQLCKILAQLRHQTVVQTGYAGGNLLNLFSYLQTDLSSFDFSHLAIRQAYLANTTLHNTNFTNVKIRETVFAETFGGVLSVAFSSDGQYLATSDTKGDIQIWDVSTVKQLVRCRGHQHWAWSVAFSPDGRYLASASDDYLVKLWDVETGQCLHTYQGHTYSVNAVAFSPKGNIVASCGQDLSIRLWEVAPEKLNPEVQTLVGHEGRVWAIAFHPNGKILASCSEDYTIRLWDVATGNCFCVWQGHDRWLRSITFSPDGKLLASGSYDNTIKLWDVKSQKCLQTLRGHRQTVTAIAFSPNGQQLASSSFDRTVKLWDVSGNCLKTFLGHSSRLWSVAYHPNEQQLVSGGDDHATKLWNLQIGRCTKTLKGHTNSVLSLAPSPDSNYLASGHEDQTIKLWDIKNGTLVQTLREHTNRVWSVAFQPASQHPLLASGSADYSIKLWDWKLGTCLQTLHGHTSWVWTVVFSPDGRQLASSSYDQTVKLWDINTGECLKTFKGHNSPVVSVAFSPDGQLLASSEFDGMIKLWNIDTGECRQTLTGHTNSVWSVTFSPNGQWLLSTSFDRTLKLWLVSTGKCLQTFVGHQDPVMVAQFSPDAQFIVSGSVDRNLKLWHISTGECYQTLVGHSELVYSLVVASISLGDATSARLTAFSGSLDETIKVWDLQTGKYEQTWRAPRPYEGMKLEEIQGLTEAQLATLQALGAAS
ncbi:eIF2A-related protein [Nostoc punctiforme]|uniref:WD-40 repeat protein n=1 Tax=Nostoc punctiforme (strain ATCC 29133 / PCC 73102) TaxID=63737 RepID=B2IVX2_NOSP7|nr:NB-ARC domain-containing protein [Nostoc punctiforme]ACC84433.1 WD-40 repeat protein [Nostoc punctiforme PCC 73102]